MAAASPIRDAFHRQGTGQALHARCLPFPNGSSDHDAPSPIADLPRRARPCPPLPAATESGFLGQAPLADFCNHFTEHGHTKRATIPRTKLAFSALFAAPLVTRTGLRAARHRGALLKPPSWRPKTPAAPAGKLRVSLRAVAPEADSNTCRAPRVTDRPSTGTG